MTTHITPDYDATVEIRHTWDYVVGDTLDICVGEAVLALTATQAGQLIRELATATRTNTHMLPTCEECACWTAKQGGEEQRGEGYNVGECAHSKLKYIYEDGPCDVDGLAYADVGYGEGAILEVGPSFGCVHWTRKEVSED